MEGYVFLKLQQMPRLGHFSILEIIELHILKSVFLMSGPQLLMYYY